MPYLQLAMEESPRYEGAPTTTPTRVSSTSVYLPIQEGGITPNPQGIDRGDEARNIPGVIPDLLDTYEPEGGIRVRGYPNALTWLLSLAGFVGAHTAGAAGIPDPDGNTVPAGANLWSFTPRTGRTAKTAQIICGYTEDNVFLRGQGYDISSLGWGVNEGEFAADLLGLVCLPVSNPGLTPSYDTQAIPHFRRADFQIESFLAGTGESDNFTVAINNPLERRDSFGATVRSYFPDRMFHGDAWPLVSWTNPKYLLDADDIAALMAMSTVTTKVKWISDRLIGATAKPYGLWLEGLSQITGGEIDRMGNRRRHGGGLSGKIVYNEASALQAKFTLVNAVTPAMLETLA